MRTPNCFYRHKRCASLMATCGILVVTQLGCASLSLESFKATPPEVTFELSSTSQAGVSISAEPHPNPAIRLHVKGSAYDFDRNSLSNELVRLLSGSFETAGLNVVGTQRIRLQVDHLDYLFFGPCIVDFHVWLGNEPAFGLQSEGSGAVRTACRQALENAVLNVASHPRTIDFLEGK